MSRSRTCRAPQPASPTRVSDSSGSTHWHSNDCGSRPDPPASCAPRLVPSPCRRTWTGSCKCNSSWGNSSWGNITGSHNRVKGKWKWAHARLALGLAEEEVKGGDDEFDPCPVHRDRRHWVHLSQSQSKAETESKAETAAEEAQQYQPMLCKNDRQCAVSTAIAPRSSPKRSRTS